MCSFPPPHELPLRLLSRFSRVWLCVRPHRRQPSRVPHPWDSPGKNTGVGCHFFLQCMKVKSESEVAQSCPTLSDPMDGSPPGSSIHGVFQARELEWGAIAFSYSYLNKRVWVNTLVLWQLNSLKLFPLKVCNKIANQKRKLEPFTVWMDIELISPWFNTF